MYRYLLYDVCDDCIDGFGVIIAANVMISADLVMVALHRSIHNNCGMGTFMKYMERRLIIDIFHAYEKNISFSFEECCYALTFASSTSL